MIFFWAILAVILLPVVECLLMWTLSGWWGWLNVLFLIIGTGAVGTLLARREGMACWRDLHTRVDRGEPPTEPIVHGVLIVVAALLLITPGLITDVFGLILLIPGVRRYGIRTATARFNANRQYTASSNNTGSEMAGETIGETIDVE